MVQEVTQPYKSMQGSGHMLMTSCAAFLCKNGVNKHLMPCKDCGAHFSGAKLRLQHAPGGLNSTAVQ